MMTVRNVRRRKIIGMVVGNKMQKWRAAACRSRGSRVATGPVAADQHARWRGSTRPICWPRRGARAGVLIVGNFNVDGAPSTTLMMRRLTALGFEAPDFLVPDRFRFGYSLTPKWSGRG